MDQFGRIHTRGINIALKFRANLRRGGLNFLRQQPSSPYLDASNGLLEIFKTAVEVLGEFTCAPLQQQFVNRHERKRRLVRLQENSVAGSNSSNEGLDRRGGFLAHVTPARVARSAQRYPGG